MDQDFCFIHIPNQCSSTPIHGEWVVAKLENLNQHGLLCITLFLLPLCLQKKIKAFSSEVEVYINY